MTADANQNLSIKRADGSGIDSSIAKTGDRVWIDNVTYTVVKMGDCSGDGVVDARDSLRILKYAVGTYKLEGAYSKAADVSKDQENDSRDSLRILKYAVGTYNIEL